MIKKVVIISLVSVLLICSVVVSAVAADGVKANEAGVLKYRNIDSTTLDPSLDEQNAESALVNEASSKKTPVRKRPETKPVKTPSSTIPTTVPTTVPTTIATTVPSTVPVQSGYNGPHAVPGRIEVEDFDNGGAGVAYNDTTPENSGGAGRLNEGVDIVTVDGIAAVSWIYNDEWTEYTVEVASSGTYTATFRVGSPGPGQQIVVTVDGSAGCTVNVPMTGGYSTYTTVSAPLPLTAGTHVVRLTYHAGEYGQAVDWFELVGGSSTAVPTTVATTVATTVPTTVPTTVATTVPTTVATTAVPTSPPSSGSTLDPTMSAVEAAATASSASSSGYGRLSAMQAAWSAWSVPSNPALAAGATNVLSSGLKNDGVTDNTASLQSLLNTLPTGAVLYFPAGTYRLNGPITITRAVTLLGSPGTILDCRQATSYVFTINRGGSAASKMAGVCITGFVIEGPGIETDPAMIDGYYLQNFRISYVKFHNIGYAAVRINTCTDATVENCIFDNVFQTGQGYGVCVTDHSDRILIRNNFFVTKGRHSFTTGTANPSLPVEDYVRQVTFEINYCENTQGFGSAADTHEETIGPIIVRNNVFNNCQHGVRMRGGYGEIYDNVVIGKATTQVGVYLYDQAIEPNAFDTQLNKIERNTILGTFAVGILCGNSNDLVRDNILSCSGSNYGLYVDGRYYAPEQVLFERNIVKGFNKHIDLYLAGSNVGQVNNWYL